MRVGRLRSILWLTATAAAAIGIAAIGAAVLLPLEEPATTAAAPAGRLSGGSTRPAADNAIPPLTSFEPAWKLPLRRPLVDPPPPAVAAAPEKPASLNVRLIGTILDGERPCGVFLIGLANVELKTVGDRAGPAQITAIDENTATLSYLGETVVLKREKNPFDSTGGKYDGTVQSKAAETKRENGS